jgi:hypothetical protein
MPAVPFIPLATAVIGGIQTGKQNRANRRQASQIAAQKLALQKEQQAKLDAQVKVFQEMEFDNPYANIENPYEDLTVNQQQAEFMSQQAAQSRADVLGGLRGAAGGAGVAALAQSLANQGALTAQRISATIGQQESANQRLRAQGAFRADAMERGGEAQIQQMEASRQATILGMQAELTAGAMSAATTAQGNQLKAGLYGAAATQKAWGNIGEAFGGVTKQEWGDVGIKW